MPDTDQEGTLAELVVKEAVEKGMDSPLRETIVDAVEEASGDDVSSKRTIPLAGALFSIGAALGYLAGKQDFDLEGTPLEDLQGSKTMDDVAAEIEDVTDELEEKAPSDLGSTVEDTEETVDDTKESGSRRLPKLLLALVAFAGAIALRRRFSGEDDDGWEPIEEFEPATMTGDDDDDEMEMDSDDETADEDGDEGEEVSDGEEGTTAGADEADDGTGGEAADDTEAEETEE